MISRHAQGHDPADLCEHHSLIHLKVVFFLSIFVYFVYFGLFGLPILKWFLSIFVYFVYILKVYLVYLF